MAVTESPPAAHHAPAGKKSNWFQQHKALTAVGAGGVAILLLSHKGATSGSSTDSTAADAAAEQAAIDQAVGDQTGLSTNTGGGAADGSDDSGGDGTTGTGTAGTASGGSNAGGGDGGGDASGTGGLTINVNTPVNPSPTVTTPTAVPPPTGGVPPAAKSSPGVPTPKGKIGVGLGAAGAAAGIRTAGSTPKKIPAPKVPAKPTKPKSKTHGSVMKHGRAFSGAQSVHVGQGRMSSDGVLHEPVTVNYGGYSETHMSHNRGQAWTDNVPGYSPPSRGVPLVRLGTPPMIGADWNEND